MTTPAQKLANQNNSQSSSGPKTRKGKLRALRNAIKHGLSGKRGYVLPHQEQELGEMVQNYFDQYHPQNSFEDEILRQAALASFRIVRCHRAEAAICKIEHDQLLEDNAEELAKLAQDMVDDTVPITDVSSTQFRAMMSNPDCVRNLLGRMEDLRVRLDAGEALDAAAENSLRLVLRLPKYYRWNHLGDLSPHVDRLRENDDPVSRAALGEFLRMFHPLLAEMGDLLKFRSDDPLVGVLDLFTIGYEPPGWRQIQRYRRDAERLLFNSLSLLTKARAGKAVPPEDEFAAPSRTTSISRGLSGVAEIADDPRTAGYVKPAAAPASPAAPEAAVRSAPIAVPTAVSTVSPASPARPMAAPVTLSPVQLATQAEIGFDSRRREEAIEPPSPAASASAKPPRSRHQQKKLAAQRRKERKKKNR